MKKIEDLGIQLDAIIEELTEFLSLDTSGIPEEGLPPSDNTLESQEDQSNDA